MNTNVLILGSGGREHCLAWKIAQSNKVGNLFVAPGNGGTSKIAKNVTLDDFQDIGEFCIQENVDLIVVGPEIPLVDGIVDFFRENQRYAGIELIGPSRVGAMLEGSKSFAKEFMLRHGIPTAGYKKYTVAQREEGIEYLKNLATPIVLKADGLAAGKGVVICETNEHAIREFEAMLGGKFGSAGNEVVVEEFLTGIEFSIFALTDGKTYLLMPNAKDYKRVSEGDTGLNTGGMGAISPVPFVNAAVMHKVKDKVIEPTIQGINSENIDYKGFVYFGLILVNEEPYVIEYNCRMGDPETEAVIPRIESDFLQHLLAVNNGDLGNQIIIESEKHAATVMATSGGYPEQYEKGKAISFSASEKSTVFHAGTKQVNDQIVTNGGRVLAITSLSDSLEDALNSSYETISSISFEKINFRKDIGYEFI